MNEVSIENGKVVVRDSERQARLRAQHLEARLAALEAAERKRDPGFKPPDPPAGMKNTM